VGDGLLGGVAIRNFDVRRLKRVGGLSREAGRRLENQRSQLAGGIDILHAQEEPSKDHTDGLQRQYESESDL
jgi:hypothetical protein